MRPTTSPRIQEYVHRMLMIMIIIPIRWPYKKTSPMIMTMTMTMTMMNDDDSYTSSSSKADYYDSFSNNQNVIIDMYCNRFKTNQA